MILEYIAIIVLISIIIATTFDINSLFYQARETSDIIREKIGSVDPMVYITIVLVIIAIILGFLLSLPK
jgi:hypothetical protein